jgi:molybdopterin-guanine dinucleotide biosynthesis protein A
MTAMTDIPLAILAGGEGSRIGTPKALLRIQNRPILDYLIDRIAWPGPLWLITAPGREHPPGWERFNRELVDPVAGLGPLRGVLTALEHLDRPELIITTVDMPAMTAGALGWMVEQLHTRPEILGMMCRRDCANGPQIEPFPLALRRTGEPVIRQRLERGRLSVQRLLEALSFTAISPPPDWPSDLWLNLNTPADLQALDAAGRLTCRPTGRTV